MTVTATAKRRRSQARLRNGRKLSKADFKEMLLAKTRRKDKR